MKLGRRGFIAALGFGAAAAPAMAPKIMSGGGLNSVGMAAGYAYPTDAPDFAPQVPWAGSSLGEVAWKALHQRVTDLEQKRSQRWDRRIEGLDPDLWVMRSVSLPARMALQAKRDRELDDEIQDANWSLFGKPERHW